VQAADHVYQLGNSSAQLLDAASQSALAK